MANNLEQIVSWAKRRGFVMPGSEIYGGISGIYDFGPYGLALKNNIKKLWWKTFVENRDDVVGIESAILMNKKVWQASGHEKGFVDELVECKKCNARFRLDEIDKSHSERSAFRHAESPANAGSDIRQRSFVDTQDDIKNDQSLKCPKGGHHELTESKEFNTMFKVGETYLRPETAQGMFTDFKQILEVSRKKIPFGIAQIGKSFRNEIMTKDFLFRVREFEIAEIEYFVPSPSVRAKLSAGSSGQVKSDEEWFDYWLEVWEEFILSLGIKKENLELHEHGSEGLAHYSKRTVDIQYKFPFGLKELAGVANRTDFDLKAHIEKSGKDLQYFDPETSEKYLPYVIEPTVGIERLMLAVICDAFEEVPGGRAKNGHPEQSEGSPANAGHSNKLRDSACLKAASPQNDNDAETILHFNPKIAPVKVAVLPLVKKLSVEAKKIYDDLKVCWNSIEFDESGSIGRRYRRQDEIGTPFCVTIDFETLEDKKVTIRDRDTMKQERIAISELKNHLFEKLENF